MAFLTWDERYAVHDADMDTQHQTWFRMLSQFYEQLEKGGTGGDLAALLQEAIAYTQYHFDEEERLMQSMGYPRLAEQKRLHQEIEDKLRTFQGRLLAGRLVMSLEVTQEMKKWISDHILQEDKQYEPYLARATSGAGAIGGSR